MSARAVGFLRELLGFTVGLPEHEDQQQTVFAMHMQRPCTQSCRLAGCVLLTRVASLAQAARSICAP